MCASPAEGSLLDALLAAHAVLGAEGVDHALCGGVAANLYRADVRATTDVDICIVCAAPQLVSLARTFEERGWRAHPAWREAEQLRIERDDLPRVDLLIASTDYEREAVRRAVTANIDDEEIRVLVPEDLIVFKLVAGRHRDYEAVAAIIGTHPNDLDRDFIQSKLAELGMADRWPRALEAAISEGQDLG